MPAGPRQRVPGEQVGGVGPDPGREPQGRGGRAGSVSPAHGGSGGEDGPRENTPASSRSPLGSRCRPCGLHADVTPAGCPPSHPAPIGPPRATSCLGRHHGCPVGSGPGFGGSGQEQVAGGQPGRWVPAGTPTLRGPGGRTARGRGSPPSAPLAARPSSPFRPAPRAGGPASRRALGAAVLLRGAGSAPPTT